MAGNPGVERFPVGLEQLDERWFSQPARKRPQNITDASVEDFDAAGAKSSLKLEGMYLSTLRRLISPEPGFLRGERRGETLSTEKYCKKWV
ncbi:hypothetical protein [Oricola sp.]|uniref:hypothetical protein n=1 Tax=Oricola sp. TaxID=1979950 RepID=UPI003BACDF90